MKRTTQHARHYNIITLFISFQSSRICFVTPAVARRREFSFFFGGASSERTEPSECDPRHASTFRVSSPLSTLGPPMYGLNARGMTHNNFVFLCFKNSVRILKNNLHDFYVCRTRAGSSHAGRRGVRGSCDGEPGRGTRSADDQPVDSDAEERRKARRNGGGDDAGCRGVRQRLGVGEPAVGAGVAPLAALARQRMDGRTVHDERPVLQGGCADKQAESPRTALEKPEITSSG